MTSSFNINEQINVVVCNCLNEQYANQVLEAFNIKQAMQKAINYLDDPVKDQERKAQMQKDRELCKIYAKMLVARLAQDIKKSKGADAVKKFTGELEAKITQEISKHKLSFKKLANIIKVSAVAAGVASGAYFANISNQEMPAGGEQSEVVQQMADSIQNDKIKQGQENLPEYGMTPLDYVKKNGVVDMHPTKECQDYIKKSEVLCQFPYYALGREMKLGIITIGYGHVIRDQDGRWHFPNTISEKRQKEIKNQILSYARNGQILQSLCDTNSKGQVYNTRRHKKVQDVITREEAEKFFQGDLETADHRVKISLGIISTSYNEGLEINENVKYYCYYNQNIYDMLVSWIYNAGAISKKNAKFIDRLQDCRYDKEKNMPDSSDMKIVLPLMAKGSNGRNLDRRAEEYQTFVASPDTLTAFDRG